MTLPSRPPFAWRHWRLPRPDANAIKAISQKTGIVARADCIHHRSDKRNGAIRQKIAIAQYVTGWKTYGFSSAQIAPNKGKDLIAVTPLNWPSLDDAARWSIGPVVQ
jgi:hypothetical protein